MSFDWESSSRLTPRIAVFLTLRPAGDALSNTVWHTDTADPVAEGAQYSCRRSRELTFVTIVLIRFSNECEFSVSCHENLTSQRAAIEANSVLTDHVVEESHAAQSFNVGGTFR
jgi:hypothetical protein